MGYQTNCLGTITITPAIPWTAIKGSPFLPGDLGGDDDLDVVLVVAESTVDMGSGPLIARAAREVAQRWDDEPTNYDIVEDLQRLIDAFPDHEFSGRFNCQGKEPGDLWRLTVRGRTAVQTVAVITWPDEDHNAPVVTWPEDEDLSLTGATS